MRDYWNTLIQEIRPTFHEESAYLIALSFCWLLVFYPEFRQGFFLFFTGFGSMSPFFLALGLIVTGGMLLSLVHVFLKRKKSALEKALMGWFLMGTSSVASFVMGSEVLSSRSPIAVIIPAWNILMSVFTLFQMATHEYDVADDETPILEIIGTTTFLVAILLFAGLYLRLSWAMTYSVCIFYSTSIVFIIAWVVGHLSMPNRRNQSLDREASYDQPDLQDKQNGA